MSHKVCCTEYVAYIVTKRMEKEINPFELFSYQGPAYFCDREEELSELIEVFDNRRNTVLHSRRRLGKTNLIHHWHYHLSKRKDVICIYLDVLNTTSDADFINNFVTAIINGLEEEEGRIAKFLNYFKNVKPQVGVDPINGTPTFTIQSDNANDIKYSLDAAMGLLIDRKENIQIAIDEFQQIGNYENTVIDATIRSYFPKAKNIHFLFSGSDQHLLTTLFSSPTSPLFASTQMMELNYIGHAPYYEFIKHQFESNGKTISDIVLHRILTWTKQHTFYTHFLCNTLYNNTGDEVADRDLQIAMDSVLKQFEMAYYFFEKTLAGNQWLLLKAIAKEGDAKNLTKKAFLNKYNFSTTSLKQALEVLLEKQLVHEKVNDGENTYSVYDVFLSRWLESRN